MRSERLFRILGLVDDDLIEDADRPMQRNMRTAWRPWAAIRSATASARVRSNFPCKNARLVNSPGWAGRAPAA